MNILIVCESQAIKDGVIDHLKGNKYSIHNNYKVVSCESNVVDSAVVTALEVNADLKRYELIVSVSKSTSLDVIVPTNFIMPKQVTDGKVNVISIDGIEDCCMISGVFTQDDVVNHIHKYGKEICYDSIAYGVSYVADDYGISNVAFSLVDTKQCGAVINVLEMN